MLGEISYTRCDHGNLLLGQFRDMSGWRSERARASIEKRRNSAPSSDIYYAALAPVLPSFSRDRGTLNGPYHLPLFPAFDALFFSFLFPAACVGYSAGSSRRGWRASLAQRIGPNIKVFRKRLKCAPFHSRHEARAGMIFTR